MSLEAYRGTCRKTTGKACALVLVPVLVIALVQELLLVPVVELEGPRKMVLSVVRKGEAEGHGEAGEGLNSKNNSGNGAGMV